MYRLDSLRVALLCLFLFNYCVSNAVAGVAEKTLNFVFAGQELGVSSSAQMQKDLRAKAEITEVGVDAMTGGKVFRAAGKIWRKTVIDAVFVYDKTDLLAGITITAPSKTANTLFGEMTRSLPGVEGRPNFYLKNNGTITLTATSTADDKWVTIELATIELASARHPQLLKTSKYSWVWYVAAASLITLVVILLTLRTPAEQTENNYKFPKEWSDTEPQLAAPAKATPLEIMLDAIPSSRERQDRMLMLGDPAVKVAFWRKMKEQGKVNRDGSLNASMKESITNYREVTRRVGVEVEQLALITAERSGWANLNPLAKHHALTILVAGTEVQRRQASADVRAFAFKLVTRGVVRKESIKIPLPGQPLILTSHRALYETLALASEAVITERGRQAQRNLDTNFTPTVSDTNELYNDDPFVETGSDIVINPANGMLMTGGMGGFDVYGNTFGTDYNDPHA